MALSFCPFLLFFFSISLLIKNITKWFYMALKTDLVVKMGFFKDFQYNGAKNVLKGHFEGQMVKFQGPIA